MTLTPTAVRPLVHHQPSPWRRAAPVSYEQDRRLSESLIWELQRRFFASTGVAAWAEGKVPFYVTSNAFIADAYAEAAVAFFADTYTDDLRTGRRPPLTVVELGAGHGRFSYLLLTSLRRRLSESAHSDLPLRYVMTDFTDATMDAWEVHPRLTPFLTQGVLDFAVFDADNPAALRLRHAGSELDAFDGPVLLVANYVFDSVPADCFTITEGVLHEKLVTASAPPELDPARPDALNQLTLNYHTRAINPGTYYPEPDLNSMLDHYAATLPDGDFLLPTTALRCLRHFISRAPSGLLLLSSDKGHLAADDLGRVPEPQFVQHGGAFSVMVNFDALATYTETCNGVAYRLDRKAEHLQFAAFAVAPSHTLRATARAIAERFDRFGPDDFFSLRHAIDADVNSRSIPELLAYLRLSNWDADCYLGCHNRLLELAGGCSDFTRRNLRQLLHGVWSRYYTVADSADLPFCLGQLASRLGFFRDAIDFFDSSLDLLGASPETLCQLAVCHYSLHEPTIALDLVERALLLDPRWSPARAMRTTLLADDPAADVRPG